MRIAILTERASSRNVYMAYMIASMAFEPSEEIEIFGGASDLMNEIISIVGVLEGWVFESVQQHSELVGFSEKKESDFKMEDFDFVIHGNEIQAFDMLGFSARYEEILSQFEAWKKKAASLERDGTRFQKPPQSPKKEELPIYTKDFLDSIDLGLQIDHAVFEQALRRAFDLFEGREDSLWNRFLMRSLTMGMLANLPDIAEVLEGDSGQ